MVARGILYAVYLPAHNIITNQLEALLFIVDLDELVECSAYLMRSFKAIQRDTNKINEYKKRKSKNKLLDEIKRVAKLNRFNFELAYSNNRSKLTELFNELRSVDTDSQQLSMTILEKAHVSVFAVVAAMLTD